MASLAQKLRIAAAGRYALVNAPAGYLESLGAIPEGVVIATILRGAFDWVQLFVRTRAELEKIVPRALRALKPVSLLWITYPKPGSGVPTDLTRDLGWDSLQTGELKWLTLISIDATWTAFALRPYHPMEARRKGW